MECNVLHNISFDWHVHFSEKRIECNKEEYEEGNTVGFHCN